MLSISRESFQPVQAPITPPSHAGNLPSLTWAAQREANAKESPSRPPDPEHLKAVWSSTSNKADTPSVNSLQGITDDLPAVPLTIQDAKLEDIPTPPLSTSHASRMSIMHDITRTFQQVPISSSSSGHQSTKLGTTPLPSSNSLQSQSVTSPSHRPHQLPPPSMSGGMRVPYPGYPSPMMSSPSPTLVYPPMTPSPIPGQMVMNGAQYPGMWMAVSPNGPPGMMRPMTSPYAPQLMPYSHAGAMYHAPPNMQGHTLSPSPSMQGRSGNVMMTPSTSQAQVAHPPPMYATSPVVMHALPAMHGPGSNYPGSAQGRGGPPPRGPYDNAQGMVQQSPSFGPQQPAGYSVPPNMFARSTW